MSVEKDYLQRLSHRQSSESSKIWNLLDQVCDPEIPVLSLWELGVLQHVEQGNQGITVVITPTYCGCPALEVMKSDILNLLSENGYHDVTVQTSVSPAWSSQWLSPDGREKLRKYGIAPPHDEKRCRSTSRFSDPRHRSVFPQISFTETSSQISQAVIPCPQCNSEDTIELSEFGSTACKALYKCQNCLEPVDYFKPI